MSTDMSSTTPSCTLETGHQPNTGDIFTKYARRITTLICGTPDANGGKTVANWEHFLRSAENRVANRNTSIINNMEFAGPRFSQTWRVSLDESSTDKEESSNSPVSSYIDDSSQESLQSRCEIEFDNAQFEMGSPAATSNLQDLDYEGEAAAVSTGVGNGSSERTLSECPSRVNSPRTSVESYSSVTNNASDSVVTANSGETLVSTSLLHASSENLGEIAGCSAPAANPRTDEKKFLNWFRNPWVSQSNSHPSHSGTVERCVKDMIEISGLTKDKTLFLDRSYFDKYLGINPDNDSDSNTCETFDVEDGLRINNHQNTHPISTRDVLEIGRGSPDGHSSQYNSSSDEILVVIDDSYENGVIGEEEVIVATHEEGQPYFSWGEERRPDTPQSLTVTEESESEHSWVSSGDEEQLMGMLPAGYNIADDELFAERFGGRHMIMRSEFFGSRVDLSEEPCNDWIRIHHPTPLILPPIREVPPGCSPYMVSTNSVINALECPVCLQYMLPPIWLCMNGHNICGHCQRRLTTCPLCRGRLLNIRNLALESIAGDLSFQTLVELDKDSFKESDDAKEGNDGKFFSANLSSDSRKGSATELLGPCSEGKMQSADDPAPILLQSTIGVNRGGNRDEQVNQGNNDSCESSDVTRHIRNEVNDDVQAVEHSEII